MTAFFNNLQLLSRYLYFLVRSVNCHSIHSPAIYKLVDEILKKPINKDILNVFRLSRRELLKNRRVVEVSNFVNKNNRITYSIEMKSIGRIFCKTALSQKDGELLYRLVDHYKPQNIIELGTGFGISTLYIAQANPASALFTFEGCANKAEVATSLFRHNNLTNISLQTGIFDQLLPAVLDRMKSVDFVFIDGDHSSAGLLNYIKMLLPICTDTTIIALHDIHWSRDMEQGWQQLIGLPEVKVSIDFFTMGLLFFDPKLSKQDFRIRL